MGAAAAAGVASMYTYIYTPGSGSSCMASWQCSNMVVVVVVVVLLLLLPVAVVVGVVCSW